MRIKTTIIALLAILSLGLLSVPAAAFNPLQQPCQSITSKDQPNPANSPACQQNNKQNGQTNNPVVDTIRTASTVLALVGGIAAIIVIIISGLMFVTAGGAPGGQRSSDPNKVKNARSALTGAIIGLLIIAFGWTIITFVTDRFIG